MNQILHEKWVDMITISIHIKNWLASSLVFQGGYLENQMQLWPCSTQCRQAVYGSHLIWWVDFGGFWWVRFLQNLTPLQGGVLDFFFQRKVKESRSSCFFLRETCKKKCSNIFFTNKQVDHHPIQLVGGGGKISVAQAASWNPLSLLTKNHQRNEGLVKRKRS